MPPSFFKDTPNVLGSEFVSRAFSFNISGPAANPSVSTTTRSSGSIPENSNSLPRASSTASLALKCDKSFLHGGTGSSLLNNNRPSTHISAKSQKLPSLENTIATSIESSTGETSDTSIEKSFEAVAEKLNEDDEDIIEITDVRELPQNDGFHDEYTEEPRDITSRGHPVSSQSPSDVLIEALFKSQRLCSSLKKKLEIANSKIYGQKEEIEAQKKSVQKYKVAHKEFSDHLDSLGLDLSELRKSRTADSNTISELRVGYQGTLKMLKEYKDEINSYQQKIEFFGQEKVASCYEAEKKNQEIKILKTQLDDTQGLLSEQKIRTTQLEKILSTSRREYDAKISEILTNSTKIERALSEMLEKSTSNIEKSMGYEINSVIVSLRDLLTSILQCQVS
ncbi:CYFA0S03e01398g1_1 [Cyberlindnera fabianii]|uniref:CYFA0S03e01398g1_1 n=1 Tax=Cyberlindnera fabianii TaxID=36022 RepID=A0A061ANX4_CYBFA|nr:CYFA0S03e01398g1_1 [Cyberlindnera fabianii]